MLSKYNKLLFRDLKTVRVSQDKQELIFEFMDGSASIYKTSADCCSSSWIEYLTNNVRSAEQIVDVEELANAKPQDGHQCGPWCAHDVLKTYQVVFITNKKNRIVVEFRNNSNGYYGGDLLPVR